MLNMTRLRLYVNAYNVRMEKGESIESIDNSFLSLKRLKKEEIKQIHDIIQK